MNALITIDQPRVTALSVAMSDAMAAADEYAAAAEAPATRRAYISDFSTFRAWCEQNFLQPMPAQPEVIAAYISARARAEAKPSSIQRAVAAIRYAHKTAGYEPPTNSELVKRTMRGIRRTSGAAPERKKAATADIVANMLEACPDTMKGKRDRALIALGFAGAFRRSELVALNVEDLVEDKDGLRVAIRHSKTDQEGVGREVPILKGSRLRPVEAVQEWLQAARIEAGPIFRKVGRGDSVSLKRLTSETVCDVVKYYAGLLGFDPDQFGGHSLRAGFVTSATESNARVETIQKVSGHRSVEVLYRYVRSAELFKDHAGAAFL